MTQTQVAKHFLRWYSKAAPGLFTLADNCPPIWRQFIGGIRSPMHRQMVPVILTHLVNRTPYEQLDRDTLLNWILTYPELDRRADTILSQKTSPKSFAELLDKIYRSEIREISQLVTEFLKQQLAD